MINTYYGFTVGQQVRNKITDELGTVVDPRHAQEYRIMDEHARGGVRRSRIGR
jgi:hypothetical protein